jgi:hypothetical protein
MAVEAAERVGHLIDEILKGCRVCGIAFIERFGCKVGRLAGEAAAANAE